MPKINPEDLMDMEFVKTNFQLLIDNLYEMKEYYCSFHNATLRKELRDFLGVNRLIKKYDNTKVIYDYIQANKDKFDIKVDETYYASMFINSDRDKTFWQRLSGVVNCIHIVIRYKETGKIAYKFVFGEWGKSLNDIIKDIHYKKRMKYVRYRKVMRKKLGYNGM